MPKNNELTVSLTDARSINAIVESEHLATSANDDDKGTYLTEENIKHLKSMFPTEQKYIEYMETLWTLRALSSKACREAGKDTMNHDNPMFKIVELTNELIGCLLNDKLIFHINDDGVYYTRYYSGKQ